MESFPEIKEPIFPLKNKWENPVLTSKMENGIVISRPKFTRLRDTFTLTWNALPTSDYTKLKEFWGKVLGGSMIFLWTYPSVEGDSLSGKEFRVRFSSGTPNFELVSPGFYNGSVTIEEV